MRKGYLKKLLALVLAAAISVPGNITYVRADENETVSEETKELPYTISDTTEGILDSRIKGKKIEFEGAECLFVMDQQLIFLKKQVDDTTSDIYIIGPAGLITTVNIDSDDEWWNNDEWNYNGYQPGAIGTIATDLSYRQSVIQNNGTDPGMNSIHNIYCVYDKKNNKHIIIDATDGDYVICDKYREGYSYDKNIIIQNDGEEFIYNLERGEVVNKNVYDSLRIEDDKIARGEKDGKYALIALDGSKETEAKYDVVECGNGIYVGRADSEGADIVQHIDIFDKSCNIVKSFELNNLERIEYEIIDDKVYVEHRYEIVTKAVRQSDGKVMDKYVYVSKVFIVSPTKCVDAGKMLGGEYSELNRLERGNEKTITDAVHIRVNKLNNIDSMLNVNNPNSSGTGFVTLWNHWVCSKDYDAIIDNHFNFMFKISDEDVMDKYTFSEDGYYVKLNKTTGIYEYHDRNGAKLCELGKDKVYSWYRIGDNHLYLNDSIVDVRTGEKVLDDISSREYNDDFAEYGYIFVRSSEDKAGILRLSDNSWTGYNWDCTSERCKQCKIYRLGNNRYVFKIHSLYLNQDYSIVLDNDEKYYDDDAYIGKDYISFADSSNSEIITYDNEFNLISKRKYYGWRWQKGSVMLKLCDSFVNMTEQEQYKDINFGYYKKDGSELKVAKEGLFSEFTMMINGIAFWDCREEDPYGNSTYHTEVIDKNANTILNFGGSYYNSWLMGKEFDISSGWLILPPNASDIFKKGTIYIYDFTDIIKRESVKLTSENNIKLEFDNNMGEDATLILKSKEYSESDAEYTSMKFEGKLLDDSKTGESVKFSMYNIAVLNDKNENVTFNKKVTIRIPCPEEYHGNNTKVYRVNDDGTFTDMNAIYEDGDMVFEEREPGTYILTESGLVSNPDIIYGDVNDDGDIDSMDAVILKKYLAGYDGLNININASDVNNDGDINTTDAVLLLKYLAGYEVQMG